MTNRGVDQAAVEYMDQLGPEVDRFRDRGSYYHRELERHLQFIVPPGHDVLVVGSRSGDLLQALAPARGVGLEVSAGVVEHARQKFPNLEFYHQDVDTWDVKGTFDYIVVYNETGRWEDIQSGFEGLQKLCRADTRIIVLHYNPIWKPWLRLAETWGRRMKGFERHWLPSVTIENFLSLAGFQTIKRNHNCLFPFGVPLLAGLLNRFVGHLPFMGNLTLNQVVIARPERPALQAEEVSVSVIVPCRNERGNIEAAVERLPRMGRATEIIYVEGHSQDGTFEECERVRDAHPDWDITVMRQDGKGKGDAVRKAFAAAKNDVLMILDADLTVPPEDLPRFFEALVARRGEFVNGSRLVYDMEDQAMRPLNFLGNTFFRHAFSYLLGQRLGDTLCGTKVLRRVDYERIARERAYFGDFDPFGDFDLLFGAARFNLKIIDLPVHYAARTYGETQISRFRHGVILLRMAAYALVKVKYV